MVLSETYLVNVPKVLSIMEKTQGHFTYGNLLREGFEESSCQLDFCWATRLQKSEAKFLDRLLVYPLPNPWVRKYNLDLRRSRLKLALAKVAKRLAVGKLSQQEYSALHLHSYVLGFLSLDLMKKLPTVISLDETEFLVFPKTAPNYKWTQYPNIALGKRVFEAAARIVTFSKWAQESVIGDYKIDREKVKVIYPGVDLKKLEFSDTSKGEPQKRFNLLFVGNDLQRKGGYDVLQVFLESLTEQAELHLVTNDPIECEHAKVRIHKNVKAYSPKWVELYQQADVFVMPTYFDGFGWVFIEAMAAGLPVIATQINAIPEIVTHGETGFLIKPGDRHDLAEKIQALIENPNLGREMGAKGRRVVERKFNAQTHCQILEDTFREVSLYQPLRKSI